MEHIPENTRISQVQNIENVSNISDSSKEQEGILNNFDDIPPSSSWHYIFTKYLPIWKLNEKPYIIINFTIERLSPYYFTHLLLLFYYFYYIKKLSKILSSNENNENHPTYFYSLTFFFIMTNLSYLVTHFTNPGILPFNWSTTKQRLYTKDELRSGFAANFEQKKWGKLHDWPSRSFFSGQYGVIVLRADHYCTYINHWIGLRNMKFFYQSLLYGNCFIIEYLIVVYKVFKKSGFEKSFSTIFLIILVLALGYFGYWHFVSIYTCSLRIKGNFTYIEQLMKFDKSFYNKGILLNLEEVFGSIYLLPLWFFPIPIPLPKDGFNYQNRPDDICIASNRIKGDINLQYQLVNFVYK